MGKLAVIGASYLQLPLVLKAKELGHTVHCFAWKDGAVCEGVADEFYPISITDKEAILEECRHIGIDGVLTIASDLAVLTVNGLETPIGLNFTVDAETLEVTQYSRNDFNVSLGHGLNAAIRAA